VTNGLVGRGQCQDVIVLILAAADVQAVLDRGALIEAVAAGLVELSAGTASVPPRVAAAISEKNALLAAMPGHLAGQGVLGAKLVSVYPGNAGSRWPTHQAVVVLFDPDTGAPEALLDGTALTAERTAAASAVATRILGDPEASVLAILGTGVQARAHALTVSRVCPSLREVRIAGRTEAKAVALAEELASILSVHVRAVPGFADALSGAGVVCATTESPDPVVRREWLAPGAHVNSVGFNVHGREVDAATVCSAFVVVESRTSALAPVPAGANDLLWPISEGLISPDHIRAELGELVMGAVPGPTSSDQLTLFKSVGVAAEDLAAAWLVVTAARKRGIGRSVDL
jgi:ornithine cyclodeaminase